MATTIFSLLLLLLSGFGFSGFQAPAYQASDSDLSLKSNFWAKPYLPQDASGYNDYGAPHQATGYENAGYGAPENIGYGAKPEYGMQHGAPAKYGYEGVTPAQYGYGPI